MRKLKIANNKNKMHVDFTFGRYDKVIDIEECHLQKEPSNT